MNKFQGDIAMKKRIIIMTSVILGLAFPAFAAEDQLIKGVEGAVETFAEGCEKELATFCKDVTPGEGRILACLYAFGDKVSPRCEYALYDSVSQLNRTLATITYVAGECRDDLAAFCTGVQPGEGRLFDCLNKNEAKVSNRCNTALHDAGWKK